MRGERRGFDSLVDVYIYQLQEVPMMIGRVLSSRFELGV